MRKLRFLIMLGSASIMIMMFAGTALATGGGSDECSDLTVENVMFTAGDGVLNVSFDTTDGCAREVTFAVYEKLCESAGFCLPQELFDHTTQQVEPNSEYDWQLDLPECGLVQADLAYGGVILDLNEGLYGNRLIQAKHLDLGECEEPEIPDFSVTGPVRECLPWTPSGMLLVPEFEGEYFAFINGVGHILVSGENVPFGSEQPLNEAWEVIVTVETPEGDVVFSHTEVYQPLSEEECEEDEEGTTTTTTVPEETTTTPAVEDEGSSTTAPSTDTTTPVQNGDIGGAPDEEPFPAGMLVLFTVLFGAATAGGIYRSRLSRQAS